MLLSSLQASRLAILVLPEVLLVLGDASKVILAALGDIADRCYASVFVSRLYHLVFLFRSCTSVRVVEVRLF